MPPHLLIEGRKDILKSELTTNVITETKPNNNLYHVVYIPCMFILETNNGCNIWVTHMVVTLKKKC
jgi:hypothetical protein